MGRYVEILMLCAFLATAGCGKAGLGEPSSDSSGANAAGGGGAASVVTRSQDDAPPPEVVLPAISSYAGAGAATP